MPKVELDAEELFNLSLAIVGLVLKAGSMSVAELSRHFGVSAGSVLKAVKSIADSEDLERYETHFYVDDDALANGEVSFSQAQTRLAEPPMLSRRQASAIAAGLDYLASLPQFRDNLDLAALREALGGSITVVQSGTTSEVDLSVYRTAVSSGKQLKIDYLNQLGERSMRLIDPLRLDFQGSRHYLRAFCHKTQDLRSFRVDRIVSAELQETDIPESSKTREIPVEIFGQAGSGHKVQVECDTSAAEVFWNFPVTTEPKRVESRLVGEIEVGNLRALGRHIARYGGAVRVLGPEAARAAVYQYALSAKERHGSGG